MADFIGLAQLVYMLTWLYAVLFGGFCDLLLHTKKLYKNGGGAAIL